MSGIDDLRTNNNYTGIGTASGTEDGRILNLGSPNITRKVRTAPSESFEGPKGSDEFIPKKRTIADLSSLPKKEVQGVDIKESIEAEVFKPGGDFDKMIEIKKKEMQEVNDLIDQHNAQVAAELGIDIPSDEELQKIGQEDMTPALIGTKYYDQADAFGRARGVVKSSPLEEKAAKEGKTIDQLVSGLDNPTPAEVTLADGSVIKPTTTGSDNEIKTVNFEKEEEEMDELEKELNEELNVNDNVKLIEESPAEESLDLLPEDEPMEDLKDIIPEPVTPVALATEIPQESRKSPEPKVEVKSPISVEKEKVETASDKITEVAKDPNIGVNTDFSIDEEDIEDIEGEDSTAVEDVEIVGEEENIEQFRASVSEKIKPVTAKLNLSSFKIVKSPVSLSAAIMESEKAAMSWVLPNSKQYIAMKEFTGKEIEQLGDNSGTNNFETMKNRYRLFYDHIVSPKPATFEQWLKTVSFLDNDHLYFAVYGANFAGSNFVAYDCPKCKKTFLSDNIPLDHMYKFKDEKVEAEFKKMLHTRESNPTGLYVSEVVQISDNFAIAFKEPSLYNMVIETSLIDEKFANKYRDIIAIVSYIDNIYYIDTKTNEVHPVGYKVDKNNLSKTIKARIITYAKILSRLAPDQYYSILSYLNAINNKQDDLTYVKPEVTCTNCKNVIEEQPVTAESLVFMRSQLLAFSTTSIS